MRTVVFAFVTMIAGCGDNIRPGLFVDTQVASNTLAAGDPVGARCRLVDEHGDAALDPHGDSLTDETEVVEGNHYFPPSAVRTGFLTSSDTTTVCPWKGDSSYYTLRVGGEENPDAAWYYPAPKPEAAQIKDHVAFWRGVEIEES